MQNQQPQYQRDNNGQPDSHTPQRQHQQPNPCNQGQTATQQHPQQTNEQQNWQSNNNNQQRPQRSAPQSQQGQNQYNGNHRQGNQQQGGRTHNQQGHNQGDNDQRTFMNIKSHGSKAAFEVAPDETTKQWHTIRLEGAPSKGDGTKAFNWNEKVSIQITKTELPIVIGVLLGFLPMCEFKNHGGDAAKWFYMENQGKNFFFKIGQGNPKRMSVCPIPTVEAHLMGIIALTQHTKNFEGLGTGTALDAIKVMCAHLVKAGLHQPQQRQQGGGGQGGYQQSVR